jgi:hypothetical protein
MTEESGNSPTADGGGTDRAGTDRAGTDRGGTDRGSADRPARLTISQRVLTLLPDLQRRRSVDTAAEPEPSAAPEKNRSSATRADSAAKRTAARPTPERSGSASNGADEDAPEDDEVATPVPAPSRTPKPSSGTGNRAADPFAGMSREELSSSMKYLDERERRFALMAGPFLAALDLVLTLITLHDNPPKYDVHHHLNKLHADPTTIVALGVGSAVIALGVMACALIRRRSLTIFGLLFAGYGGGLVTIVPSWVLAGWLYVRFNRMNKALRQRDGGARGRQTGGRVPANPRAAARAGASAARERAQSPRRNRKEPVSAGPNASKRYTPPKPSRPRPPTPSDRAAPPASST